MVKTFRYSVEHNEKFSAIQLGSNRYELFSARVPVNGTSSSLDFLVERDFAGERSTVTILGITQPRELKYLLKALPEPLQVDASKLEPIEISSPVPIVLNDNVRVQNIDYLCRSGTYDDLVNTDPTLKELFLHLERSNPMYVAESSRIRSGLKKAFSVMGSVSGGIAGAILGEMITGGAGTVGYVAGGTLIGNVVGRVWGTGIGAVASEERTEGRVNDLLDDLSFEPVEQVFQIIATNHQQMLRQLETNYTIDWRSLTKRIQEQEPLRSISNPSLAVHGNLIHQVEKADALVRGLFWLAKGEIKGQQLRVEGTDHDIESFLERGNIFYRGVREKDIREATLLRELRHYFLEFFEAHERRHAIDQDSAKQNLTRASAALSDLCKIPKHLRDHPKNVVLDLSSAKYTTATPPYTTATPPLPVGSIIADRYELEFFYGRGGYGAAYRAKDIKDPEFPVVLLLPAELNKADGFKRHIEQSKQNANLESGIAKHLDGKADQDPPFYVREHIRGIDLQKVLAYSNELTLPVALKLMHGLLKRVEEVHRQGVLHRDLKPANVIVGPNAELTLVDFGSSERLNGDCLLLSGGLRTRDTSQGTQKYLAPEVLKGHRANTDSEIYSLGVILDDMQDSLLRLQRRIPLELRIIVDHMTRRNPERRLTMNESVAQVLELLETSGGSDLEITLALPEARTWGNIVVLPSVERNAPTKVLDPQWKKEEVVPDAPKKTAVLPREQSCILKSSRERQAPPETRVLLPGKKSRILKSGHETKEPPAMLA